MPPPIFRSQQHHRVVGSSTSSVSNIRPNESKAKLRIRLPLPNGSLTAGVKRSAPGVMEGMAPPASRRRVGSSSKPSTHSKSSVTHRMQPSTGVSNDASTQRFRASTGRVKVEHSTRNKDPDIVVIDDSSDDEAEATAPAPSTHVIFCVDASTSMKTKDVKRDRGKISRWDAVFICLEELLEEQLSEKSESLGDIEFSLVRFSDKAETLFRCIKIGDGTAVRKKLKHVHKKWPPRGGTGFSAAFEGVKRVASGSSGNVMVVFVSDGRPGDLMANPGNGDNIQSSFRSHGMTYPSVAVHVKEMIMQHGERLSLQFLCLFKDGEKWCRKLARVFNGKFHMPQLRLGQKPSPPAKPLEVPERKPVRSDAEESEVQVIGTKSAETKMRESYEAAERAGNVVTVKDTTCMRSTFQSFSATLTTMRQDARGPARERHVVLESRTSQSAKMKFEATLMMIHPTEDGFEVPPAEKKRRRIVELSMQPFAQGGLRNVYNMVEKNLLGSLTGNPERELVAKESRHITAYRERLRFHVETLRCQARALELAKSFNSKVKVFNAKPSQERRDTLIPLVSFLEAVVYRLRDESSPGGFRYLAVEERLKGDYQKYNDNNGGILTAHASSDAEKSKRRRIKLAQAFSHFTYDETEGKEMVVDIQGVGHKYTDPQLHSTEKKYGRADLGQQGIDRFFTSHKCNVCCKVLGLVKRGRKG